MRNITKRILTLCIAIACLTISASAATNDGTFTATSNRKFYTPVSCNIESNSEHVYFNLLQWEDISFGAAYYWEGELRGVSDNISAAYSNATAVAGSLPHLYKEYDEDDVSIGCAGMSDLDSDKHYYVGLSVTKGPKYDSGVELYIESEYGLHALVDGLPLNYQVFYYHLNTKSARNITWLP